MCIIQKLMLWFYLYADQWHKTMEADFVGSAVLNKNVLLVSD